MFVFIVSTLFSAQLQMQQRLSPQATKQILESIKPYGIVFGNGEREVHVFIDPNCPVSRQYVTSLFDHHQKRFKENTYYFYLYKLKDQDSAEIIQTLLGADNKPQMLKAVMVDDEIFLPEDEPSVDKIVDKIREAAEAIGVNKRPYILIDGEKR
jgi:hypothetical protein